MWPFLIPKEGVLYEIKTTMDAKIFYFKDETSWSTMLSFLDRPWYRRLFKLSWISWEIVATKEAIRYFVWMPDVHVAKAFMSKYYAEHPEVEFVRVDDPEPSFSRPHAGTKLFTESHWTIPIKTYHNEVVDTQSELVEFLDTLSEGEEIHLQFLVQPAYRTEKDFRGIVRQFHAQEDVDETLQKDNELYLSAIEGKSTRILSRLGVKVLAFASTQHEANQLIKSAKGSIGTFSSGRLNQLKGREWWWFRTIRPLFRWEFKKRIYPMERKKSRVILGTEEVAAMLRLPSGRVRNTKLHRLKMRSTPLPQELKAQEADSISVSLGIHSYHGQKRDVSFDLSTLRYHAAFLGMSGMGKSTAMYNLVEDLLHLPNETRIGCTVIDPHGDLCRDIAGRIPPHKQDLVRYVKFSDGELPFNVYDVDFAVSEDKVAQTVADVLKRTWKDFWGPNIDDNFLNGGIALQRIGEASLPNLQRLLADADYRDTVLSQLDRQNDVENDLYLYFQQLHSLQERDFQAKTNSTLNKLRKITLSGVLGKMLRCKTNGLRFRESMDRGEITLLDLSELTTDEKKLVGSLCLTFAELAGKSRADTPADQRDKLPYHFVIVDEAPTLMEHSADAIESFSSELRKYKTSIILGMQGLKGQVPPDVSDSIFRNFGTLISFRLGNPDDAQLLNKSMPSDVLTEEDYLNVEPYHAYMRMQVGSERTRPFLLRMKPPGPALYTNGIDEIKQRTTDESRSKEYAFVTENEEVENSVALTELLSKEEEAPPPTKEEHENDERTAAFSQENGSYKEEDQHDSEALSTREKSNEKEEREEIPIHDLLL